MSDETKDILFRDMAMRLPYGVKVQWEDHGHKTNQKIVGCGTGHVTFDVTEHDSFEECSTEHTILHYDSIKPILRPLSDLNYEQLRGMGYYTGTKALVDDVQSGEIKHINFMKLIKNHYDVSLLIERGMAVDVNTLETDPYK